jgi:hypothetical protein
VNCTGVPNAQTIAINLMGVNGSINFGDVSIPMGVLLGDVTANRAVSNTDVGQVKTQVNPTALVTASNFKNDVSVNGFVTNTDVGTTKTKVGTSIP